MEAARLPRPFLPSLSPKLAILESRNVRVEECLSHLESVRTSRDGWLARCPAHDDRSPSLSIRESNGKILLHCFAECSPEAICQALGIKVSDLFSKPHTMPKPKPRIVRDAEKRIAGLRSRLTPRERERGVTVVLADERSLDTAIARALALAIEGALVQCVLEQS
jgi:hypothetical protein